MLKRPNDFLLLLVLLIPCTLFAQPADWQQHVRYKMDIHLLADQHRMRGQQTVTYYNNSPDTLQKVYYHLYFNAFQPHSMMAERSRQLPDPDDRVVPRIFNLGPQEIGFHKIQSLQQKGVPLQFEVFDTVLEAPLAQPLPPGDSTTFTMDFHSQVPLQTRRSGRDNREGIDYSMSQWYPKIAQYDKDGWHADPYVGREFYAPFGVFDVQITLPSEYVVGATGTLQNPETVGHGYASPTGAGPASPDDSLTWHFKAENVHDFAWSADPNYIHDTLEGPNNTQIHLLYQPQVAKRWQTLHQSVPEIMRFFNESYGPYPWPQFTVAQAGDGGMEYPQMIFITGRRSLASLQGVTAHEMAHQWFYGALGSNEADYAWMDEGFTSYADTEVSHHLSGRSGPASHLNSYLNVLYAQQLDLFERLNTPADWFETNLGYGIASYPGGEMLVDMLGGVISDPLRDQWLRRYYEQYTFKHPTPRDIERLAEKVSGLRLDWFFEQWTQMTRSCDYALAKLRSQPNNGQYSTAVTIERRAPVVMPVDLRLTLADGSTQWVNIPLSIMQGHKPVPNSWQVAEPWGWTNPSYRLELTTSQQVVKAEVDPYGNLPDKNRLNNSSSLPLTFSFLEAPQQGYFSYPVGWRPSVQYAADFGMGAGLHTYGQYLFGNHAVRASVKLWPQVLVSGSDKPNLFAANAQTSFIDGINYDLSYRRRIDNLGSPSWLTLNLRNHLGITENRLDVAKNLGRFASLQDREQTLSLSLVHQNRYSDRAFAVDNIAEFWPDASFVWAEIGYQQTNSKNRLAVTVDLGGALNQEFRRQNLSALRFTAYGQTARDWGPFRGTARLGVGWGARNLAAQKRFRLSGATLANRWKSDAFRTVAAAFETPRQDLHLAAFPATGPVAYVLGNRFIGGSPIGRKKLATTLALHNQPFRKHTWLSPLSVELFTGIGMVWNETGGSFTDRLETRLKSLKADAGLGVSYDVSQLTPLEPWTAQSTVLQGLNVTAKFPLWASNPNLIHPEQESLEFRWLVGITTNKIFD